MHCLSRCAAGGGHPAPFVTPEVVNALERHLRWVKKEALRRGWGEPEWLFPNDEGHPHDESRVRTRARAWEKQ